jgi:uncharacterized cupredoxin-like copper-binding protein
MRRWLILGFVLAAFTLTACGSSERSITSSGTQQVLVDETDFKIMSDVINFSSGTQYRFIVTNRGKTTHEFMIMSKSEGSMAGMSMSDMDKMASASVDMIRPGETKILNHTFPSSAAGTHPEFACYMPGHYEAGMKLEVSVST